MEVCTKSKVKEIWDYYSNQYKKKDFVLRFTLFVYLITSKIATFRSITAYNADFQIIPDKLTDSRNSLPDELKLAVYFTWNQEHLSQFCFNISVSSTHQNSCRVRCDVKARR